MKKVLSILFASLVLLSGLHLTVATHICCGELAAVKWSVTGEKATCGMEEGTAPCSKNGDLNSNCCENIVTACAADSNYFPAVQMAKILTVESIPIFAEQAIPALPNPFLDKAYHSMVGPPVLNSRNSVDQSVICVFII